MTLLKFTDFSTGEAIGIVNWFASHNVALQDSQEQISGDHKGLASQLFEMEMGTNYRGNKTFVAAFANSDLGDVTPNFCGPLNGCGWTTHESAMWSATKQFEKARDISNRPMSPVTGDLDFRYRVIDMPNFTVNEDFAIGGVATKLCRQSYGVPFAAGSGWDGPSFLSFLYKEGVKEVSDKCYSPKKKMPLLSSTYETKIPFQLFRIGDLAIIGVAGEMTTMSGRLLREEVRSILQNIDPDMKIVIAGLANSYHGYITTPAEYNQQRYEGGAYSFRTQYSSCLSRSLYDASGRNGVEHTCSARSCA